MWSTGGDKEFAILISNSISSQIMPKAKYKYSNYFKGDPTLFFQVFFHLELIFVFLEGMGKQN